MRSTRYYVLCWTAWACLLMLTGCVTSSAPQGWLPSAAEAQEHAFGGWIELETTNDADVVEGELIAVQADTVFVLNESLVAIAKSSVLEASLFGYASQWGRLGGWATFGTLSTASHGFFLVFSVPVWLFGGSAAAASQSRQPRLRFTRGAEGSWALFSTYARFPLGLPASLSREVLQRATLEY